MSSVCFLEDKPIIFLACIIQLACIEKVLCVLLRRKKTWQT